MAVLEPPSPSNANSETNEETNKNGWAPLIPGLPDEISELCLLRLSYPYQALVRSVSSSWNRAITAPSFDRAKKPLARPYLFVFAFHKSTFRVQWQALDPPTGRWFVLPPMPLSNPDAVSPSAFACASLPHQGKLFVMGGSRSGADTPMPTALVYRASANRWSAASPMPTARSYFAAGTVNGRIVTVGGIGTRTEDPERAVEIYDPESDTWASGAMMGTELTRYDSATVGSRMYVTEGWRWPFMFPPRGAVYDTERDAWTEMAEGMKEGWTGLGVAVGGRVFVIPEYGDCPMKVYDEEEDTWQYVVGERFPREAMQRPFAVWGVEGRIYVVSCGLNVAIGSVVYEQDRDRDRDSGKGRGERVVTRVSWVLVEAPEAFRELSPSHCLLLYA